MDHSPLENFSAFSAILCSICEGVFETLDNAEDHAAVKHGGVKAFTTCSAREEIDGEGNVRLALIQNQKKESSNHNASQASCVGRPADSPVHAAGQRLQTNGASTTVYAAGAYGGSGSVPVADNVSKRAVALESASLVPRKSIPSSQGFEMPTLATQGSEASNPPQGSEASISSSQSSESLMPSSQASEASVPSSRSSEALIPSSQASEESMPSSQSSEASMPSSQASEESIPSSRSSEASMPSSQVPAASTRPQSQSSGTTTASSQLIPSQGSASSLNSGPDASVPVNFIHGYSAEQILDRILTCLQDILPRCRVCWHRGNVGSGHTTYRCPERLCIGPQWLAFKRRMPFPPNVVCYRCFVPYRSPFDHQLPGEADGDACEFPDALKELAFLIFKDEDTRVKVLTRLRVPSPESMDLDRYKVYVCGRRRRGLLTLYEVIFAYLLLRDQGLLN